MAKPNIFIRPIQKSDVSQRYVDWLNDPLINRFLETRHGGKQTLDSVNKFVESKMLAKDEYLMAICAKGSQLHIGNIKIGPINSYHDTADVSLFIGERDMWGKGYAAQSIYLISKFAFESKGILKLQAGCYSTNVGSRKAFMKCGYTIEGELRSSANCEGQRVASYIMGLINGELKKPWQ